jgi:hypothetical protein
MVDNSTDDLIDALREDDLDPSESALTLLDAQITELAEVLVDFYLSSDNESPESSATTPF